MNDGWQTELGVWLTFCDRRLKYEWVWDKKTIKMVMDVDTAHGILFFLSISSFPSCFYCKPSRLKHKSQQQDLIYKSITKVAFKLLPKTLKKKHQQWLKCSSTSFFSTVILFLGSPVTPANSLCTFNTWVGWRLNVDHSWIDLCFYLRRPQLLLMSILKNFLPFSTIFKVDWYCLHSVFYMV